MLTHTVCHRAGTRKQRQIKVQIGRRPPPSHPREPRPPQTLISCTVDLVQPCTDRRQRETTVYSTHPKNAIRPPHSSTNSNAYQSANHSTVTKNKETLTIATWNVRTLNQLGKIENLILEANKFNIQIIGVSETRWTGNDKMIFENHDFIYSGGTTHEKGVGILFERTIAKSILGHWPVSDRVLLVKLQARPFNMNIVQIYAPTSESSEEEIDTFYEDLDSALKTCKKSEVTVVMGDFNAKVGNQVDDNIIGKFGLGERNERGDRLVDWCKKEEYVVTNTWFGNHKKNLWTWMSPGDQCRNQIDYILVPHRFRNSVKSSATIPSADINSDHRPIKCVLNIKLKQVTKSKSAPKLQTNVLEANKELCVNFTEEVQKRVEKCQKTNDIHEKWNNLSKCISEAANEVIPKKKSRSKQKWMTEEILGLMDERRNFPRNSNEYKIRDKQIKEKCKAAKEEWLRVKCTETEKMRNQNNVHQAVKDLTNKKKPSNSSCIKDKNGEILMDRISITQRWVEYVSSLYDDPKRSISATPFPKISEDEQILEITTSEVRSAIREMKKGKAVGQDNISIELIEALDDYGIQLLTQVFNHIYEEGEMPHELCKSTFITLPKKAGAVECDQHRTISIMSQATKLLLRIIMKRIRSKILPEISPNQFGFMKDKGTINAIFTLKMLMQRSLEKQKDLYLVFIDYSKAFDSVPHKELFETLHNIGVEHKDMCLLQNLYWNQTACVQVNNETSEIFDIKKGVRQGCVLSPDLFNIFSEYIFREIDEMRGISIGGINLTNLRFADDAVLMSYSPSDLQSMLDTLVRESEKKGLLLNVRKTEAMIVTNNNSNSSLNLSSKGTNITTVKSFKYLGSTITNDTKDASEIKRRIAIAKSAFVDLRSFLCQPHLNMETRLKVLVTYVWSSLLYACETWTIDKDSERRLEAMEMWLYRRMLRIPWTAKMTNDQVLKRVNRERSLMKTIRQRQMRFLGHIWRKRDLEMLSISGMIEGKRARGGQRTTYCRNIKQATSNANTFTSYIRHADDRQTWRRMVGNAIQIAGH